MCPINQTTCSTLFKVFSFLWLLKKTLKLLNMFYSGVDDSFIVLKENKR